jgi:DNA mismatch repair protein PMS2
VKLHDQGLESIEVTDNGHGVPKSSRPYMAMKHATSKLRKFDDLYNDSDHRRRSRRHIRDDDDDDDDDDYDDGSDDNDGHHDDCAPTLGFRGEALFCLANLSRSLVVSTRTMDEYDANEKMTSSNDDNVSRRRCISSSSTVTALGEQFHFDNDGHIIPETIKRVPLSYASGTTVIVNGLFESLPVRRVDMKRRIKVQKMKLVKMMQGCEFLAIAYCVFPFSIMER